MRFHQRLTVALAFAACLATSLATPPEYATYRREQRIDYQPDEERVLRIWVANIGQGDGILIQLPGAAAYTPEDGRERELVDVVIDGGSYNAGNAGRMAAFLHDLYPGDTPPVIEYGVITHHDKDHVVGLSRLLDDEGFTIEHLFHNGLATYNKSKVANAGAGYVISDPRAMAFVDADGQLREDDLVSNLDDAQRVPGWPIS